MLAETQTNYRFVRKTQLGPNEYRKNFHQIDRDVMSVITSAEADRVTLLMSKIYLRLVNAPQRFWERDGVLRFEAEIRGEKMVKAWAVLCEVAGVASATASKAMRWMHEQGIIGYFAGKNGAGLRVFINRAASSIGVRQAQAGKKILAFPPASSESAHGSANEPAFKDSFAVLEVSDSDINPRAPKNGADNERSDKKSSELAAPCLANSSAYSGPGVRSSQTQSLITLDEVVARLKEELEPTIRMAARQAASHEHERTREWLENRGLPKAARVAQHEAYNVLRRYGVISELARSPSALADVGRSDYTPPEPHKLSAEEITEMAGICVAMLEAQGQSIDLTLSEMSMEAGGFLLAEDAPLVREKANSLLSERSNREGK